MSITCSICLDDINDSRTLSCGHIFCRACINTWLNSHYSCPTCRSELNQRACVISSIGKQNIHSYTNENNLINEPVTIIKGHTNNITDNEKLFIYKMHGFRIEDRALDLSLNNLFICIVKNNIITFGKKIRIDDNSYYLKNAFATVRNTGVTFPIFPENRIFDCTSSDYAYGCY